MIGIRIAHLPRCLRSDKRFRPFCTTKKWIESSGGILDPFGSGGDSLVWVGEKKMRGTKK